MQGAGNDFVVVDAIGQTVRLTPAIARRIADRHFGIRLGLLGNKVRVATRGGNLTVGWDGGENDLNHAVWLTGPAVSVFEGEIEIDER